MLVVHDPLCPLTPVALHRGGGRRVRADRGGRGRRTAGHRHRQGVRRAALGRTVDRDELVCVTSPVVLPAAVAGGPRLPRARRPGRARGGADPALPGAPPARPPRWHGGSWTEDDLVVLGGAQPRGALSRALGQREVLGEGHLEVPAVLGTPSDRDVGVALQDAAVSVPTYPSTSAGRCAARSSAARNACGVWTPTRPPAASARRGGRAAASADDRDGAAVLERRCR